MMINANWLAIASGLIVVAIVGVYFRRAGSQRDKLFATRRVMTTKEIFENYFANTGVEEELFCDAWARLSRRLEVPPEKLRPTDRFDNELAPPKGYEFNDPVIEFRNTIKSECERRGKPVNTIRSVRDYLMVVMDNPNDSPK